MGAVSTWCEASRGEIDLEGALAEIVTAAGADAGMLVRTRSAEGGTQRICVCDLGAAGTRPLTASYAAQVFGQSLDVARTGTFWAQSALDPVDAVTFTDFQATRHFKDFAVLILSGGSKLRDHIELHFRHRLDPETQEILASVLNILVRNWAGRQVGLVTRSMTRSSVVRMPAKAQPGNVLGDANPVHLSRAEFRVCLFLARGLSVQGVCNALQLTEATVRSHLRNIYAKTNTSSLAELVYLLMSDRERRPELTLSRTA